MPWPGASPASHKTVQAGTVHINGHVNQIGKENMKLGVFNAHIHFTPALFGYQSVTSLLSSDQPDALSMSQGEPWLLALKRGWRSNLSAGNPSNSCTVSTKREHSEELFLASDDPAACGVWVTSGRSPEVDTKITSCKKV